MRAKPEWKCSLSSGSKAPRPSARSYSVPPTSRRSLHTAARITPGSHVFTQVDDRLLSDMKPNKSVLRRFRMKICSAFGGRFVFLDRNPVCVGISVVANTSHLPGNSRPGHSTGDAEPVSMDFLGDVEFRLGCAYGSEQV